jgi:hypothetical protein
MYNLHYCNMVLTEHTLFNVLPAIPTFLLASFIAEYVLRLVRILFTCFYARVTNVPPSRFV